MVGAREKLSFSFPELTMKQSYGLIGRSEIAITSELEPIRTMCAATGKTKKCR